MSPESPGSVRHPGRYGTAGASARSTRSPSNPSLPLVSTGLDNKVPCQISIGCTKSIVYRWLNISIHLPQTPPIKTQP